MAKPLYRGGWSALVLLLLAGAAAAGDDSPPVYDRVSLSARAERQVDNDQLTAVLYVQREGADAAELAGEVNETMRWALSQAQEAAGVQAQTLDYRTQPVYAKQVLKSWRVRQSIQLKSADATRLSALVGQLQERLSVERIEYELSVQARKAVEDELIREAIDAFSGRAELITRQLARPGYRIVSIDVSSGGAVPPRPMLRGMAMAVADAAPPALEPGSQSVFVQVSGTVELQVK